MKTWRYQRGDVPVGCLVGGAVALIVILIAIKVAPIMIHVGELDKQIGVYADRANRREYNDKRIERAILTKAESLDLPVTKKDIKIKRTSNRIKITVVYEVPIEFPGYTYVWHKEHFHERPLFYG
ncbi:MAG: DUF4845 domain-containing protein [Acidobacteria bacterium]|jgi:hypothetical protein|uniref:DUF4845 domain-containing protein n=1 Tax=Candidatus Sulfomarinibacter kjeldsenii TaxID=2885994 RepID=A0A8J6Y3Z1_9BACT|nr:DUF4845 domain-containing protein [Candidatus Sulfomarinibacter kjeldsenii]